MATIERDGARMRLVLGWPRFNGSVVTFDRESGLARIERTNLFFRSRPIERPLADIAVLHRKQLGSATYVVVEFKDGTTVSLPTAGGEIYDGAIQPMLEFLNEPDPAPRGMPSARP